MSTEAPEAPVAAAALLARLADRLTLDADFARVAASLEAGHGGTLGGVWGSSRALVAAALAKRCPGPLVVLLPHLSDVDTMAADLASSHAMPRTRELTDPNRTGNRYAKALRCLPYG